MSPKKTTQAENSIVDKQDEKTCGIIMPISSNNEVKDQHWINVRRILSEAITLAGFNAKPVWESDEINIIHKNIVQNLYDNEIVVCDVSCNNPNVMFELGLRLAFDKPTIIVSDNNTKFSFDTSIVKHIIYPRDLGYYPILDFKEELTRKITETYEKSIEDENYSVFLKHFQEIKPAKIEHVEGSLSDAVIEKLNGLELRMMEMSQSQSQRRMLSWESSNEFMYKKTKNIETIKFIINKAIANYCTDNLTKPPLKGDEEGISKLINYINHQTNLNEICSNENIVKQIINDQLLF